MLHGAHNSDVFAHFDKETIHGSMWSSDSWIYWSLERCTIQAACWWDIWNTCRFRWCNTLQLDLQLSLFYKHKVLKNRRHFSTISHTWLVCLDCIAWIQYGCDMETRSDQLLTREKDASFLHSFHSCPQIVFSYMQICQSSNGRFVFLYGQKLSGNK